MRKLTVAAMTLAVALAAAHFISCNNETKTTQPTAAEKAVPNADSLKQVLERGQYLVSHVALCLDCHSKRDFSKYSGPMVAGTEGMGGELFDQKLAGIPGMVYARNITPDQETGIGAWSDADIIRAMTQGISKNGDTLFPLMPFPEYNRMAKDDLLSIIAYIRTLKPIKNKVEQRKLMMPVSVFYPPNLKSSIDSNMRPSVQDRVAYGGYLTTLATCFECHTSMTKEGFDFKHAFAGGRVFDGGPFKVASANITPDSATGIGAWTEDRFLNKFLAYRKEESYSSNPGRQNTIMPVSFYAGMKEEDMQAIYAFLKSLPPVNRKIEKYPK